MGTRGTVLVTGAASGIGRALADRLRKSGYRVIGWDVEWTSLGEDDVVVDVSDAAAVERAARVLPGALAAVVTCAGIGSRGLISETNLGEFQRVIDVNLMGTVAVAMATHSLLADGVFVAVGSVAGNVPMARRAAYCASKAAVAMFAKVIGSEWAPDGISVLCVSPGFTDTGMAKRGAESGKTDLSKVLEHTPNGELVTESDLVDVLELAASGRLSGMTGTEIVVDGGYTAGTVI